MLSWQAACIVAGVVGIIDTRFGFACLLIVGLLGLLT